MLDAKWGSDGQVPLAPNACFAIEHYISWAKEQGFDTSDDEPLFRSLSNRNYGDRLSYQAVYNLVKDLGAIAQTEGVDSSSSLSSYLLHPASVRERPTCVCQKTHATQITSGIRPLYKGIRGEKSG